MDLMDRDNRRMRELETSVRASEGKARSLHHNLTM